MCDENFVIGTLKIQTWKLGNTNWELYTGTCSESPESELPQTILRLLTIVVVVVVGAVVVVLGAVVVVVDGGSVVVVVVNKWQELQDSGQLYNMYPASKHECIS